MPEPKTSPRWFLHADSKCLVLRDSAGREWDTFAPPDALAFFANRFEAKAGPVTLTFYYRDPPTRDTGFALWHEGAGVFLGEALGLGFWSEMDPAGQDLAVTWPTEQEALASAAAASVAVSGTSPIAVPVVPDWLGDCASIRACVRAGMRPWDPAKRQAANPDVPTMGEPQEPDPDPDVEPEPQPRPMVEAQSRVRYAQELGAYHLYRKPVKRRVAGFQELMPGQGVDGYGAKMTTDLVLVFEHDQIIRRVYATCYSNAASHWVTVDGGKFFLHDTEEVQKGSPTVPASKRPEVVIDVSGGVVQAVFAEAIDVILVDWDEIQEGEPACYCPVSRPAEMPAETLEQVEAVRRDAKPKN